MKLKLFASLTWPLLINAIAIPLLLNTQKKIEVEEDDDWEEEDEEETTIHAKPINKKAPRPKKEDEKRHFDNYNSCTKYSSPEICRSKWWIND